MSHSSLYLTNLYNDLITNTPQTITMDIPSEVGQGQISQTKIKHGVILSDWKMCYQSDMNVQGPVSGEYMQIIFCLNDGISWGIMNENRSITIQKNESCIYAGHDGTEYICYKKDSNFSFKSIKIPIPYFSQLLADYFDGQEITVYEKKLLNGIAKVSVTPIMEQILSETSKFSQYRGGLGYLYLDGKLLELLSIYLGEVLELDILMGKNISMSRTERTAIMEAKPVPVMGVMGAFVFAAQMINFTIPGTGSSGHLCGGMLLAAIVGPYAAFLTMIGVLLIQCLLFADGGLMALGANIWNMAFYGCFVGGLIWRAFTRKGLNRAKIIAASLIGCILSLQLGAFSVSVETLASGITALPFGAFLLAMQPIHLAIGAVEGCITAAVLAFLYEARPSLLWQGGVAEIGRASCRERLYISAGAVSL